MGEAATYGTSVQGRPLLAVTLPGDGPVVLVTAAIHGIEYVGTQVALEILRAGPLPGATRVVCPVLNPDGYARTWEQVGEGGVAAMRKNARGVDLNRNFPLPWSATPSRLGVAGSDDPAAATYRGPAPLSEPEASGLAALVQARRPHASANLHSFLGTLFAARVWHPGDWMGYQRLSKAFRAGQGTWPGYRRLGTPLFDVFTGELEDWQHHVQQCWAVCVECLSLGESWRQRALPAPFWRFNPAEPGPLATRDAAGVRSLLSAALTLPRPPARPEAAATRPSWR
ncbi:MAG: M14 family metallopeptidase [Myxococcota bacterium]